PPQRARRRRGPARRAARNSALPDRAAHLPRAPRDVLGSPHDGDLRRRDDSWSERGQLRSRGDVRDVAPWARGAALRDGHRLLDLALRPGELARAGFSRSQTSRAHSRFANDLESWLTGLVPLEPERGAAAP